MRLVLTEEQSKFIRESGERFFVIHPGSTTDPGRMILDMIPCDYQQAVAAVRVAKGEATATAKRKTPEILQAESIDGR
jgi:hypothetical protein